jgi:hypothetical protein
MTSYGPEVQSFPPLWIGPVCDAVNQQIDGLFYVGRRMDGLFSAQVKI